VVKRLLRNLPKFEKLYGVDDVWNVALASLFAYYEFSRKNGVDDTELHRKLEDLKAIADAYDGEPGSGGARTTSRDEIHRAAKRDLEDFFTSRHSIRDFAAGEISPDLIRAAVRMAQRAPSVCNRQSSKVYVLRDEQEKRQALALQGGNRGFGEQAELVMIVTSDVSHFVIPGERNQCWVDGALFAMSLVYALHSLGLGTCCLNWAKKREVDRELKEASGIPEGEAVIMMIAVGRLPDSLQQEARRRVDRGPPGRPDGQAVKIGILTLHSGINEGAMLQAYALAKNLAENVAGAEVEVVDHRYRTKTLAVYGDDPDERTEALDSFLSEQLPLSRRQFFTDDHGETFEYLNENYDTVVVGSDEVWKLHYTRRLGGLLAVQDNPWQPPFPNAFWPDHSVKIRKISYAASVGNMNWLRIPRRHVSRIRSILDEFSLLGVRDRRARDFLRWLYPGQPDRGEWVPDPTFSVDLLALVDRDQVRAKLEAYGVDFARPRLGIVLPDAPRARRCVERFRERGYQVIGMSMKNRLSDVELFSKGLSPLEWLAAFGCFDTCITQRMHPAIACLLNGTPFAVVDFYKNTLNEMTKLRDLLSSFDLLDYYYYWYTTPEEQLQGICERLLQEPWPEEKVARTRQEFNVRAAEFTHKIEVVQT
jgi:nitroreductase